MTAALPGAGVDWRALNDQDAADTWAALIDWTTWLRRRYRLTASELPACWGHHGAAVEELSALRSSWEAAYDTDFGGGSQPSGWHQDLDRTLDRLSSRWLRGCVAGECALSRTEIEAGRGGG